jgi:hypothetical protein
VLEKSLGVSIVKKKKPSDDLKTRLREVLNTTLGKFLFF